ncbi:YopX family protein [Pediococcus acidilactici]|uniref:YopX family protein n=1 Tax=Pediococcus acidilactici TaxID=1254 RepID=UPI000FF16845|nr:YopX family protein [Pediococcus acidilactici]RWY86315.1 hypothetical protein EQG54_05980 [Pediococcus acidilactici]
MIKFRAWDNLLNKMLVVYRISFDGPVDGVQVHCYLDDRGAEGSTEYAYDGDGLILEQFTGLTDVNGKDIYEGDIIKFFGANKKIKAKNEFGIIVYKADRYGAGFNSIIQNKEHGYGGINIAQDIVVGNVHENPELLKE